MELTQTQTRLFIKRPASSQEDGGVFLRTLDGGSSSQLIFYSRPARPPRLLSNNTLMPGDFCPSWDHYPVCSSQRPLPLPLPLLPPPPPPRVPDSRVPVRKRASDG